MPLLNTNQSHSIPKKSSVSFIGGITDAFKSRSQNILSGYESLTRNKKQPVKHSTLERSAALSLDILNFEYFYIVKLGGKEEQFTLPSGELVVPCVFEYKYTDEAIIKKSIEKGHYYLWDGDHAAKEYFESKSGQRRKAALVTLPITESSNIKLYSRSLGADAKYGSSMYVAWVQKITKDTELSTGLNSLLSIFSNGKTAI